MLTLLVLPVGTGMSASAATPWQWPVTPAHVVHEFDPPANPYGSGHRGVDLAVTVGQVVVAPQAGTVTFAGVIAGRGVVVVSHGDLRTTYEPVNGVVAVGVSVMSGEVFATVQAFGFHCSSPCLHWGARRGETYIDPTSLVVVKPSRLLPLWGGRAGGSGSGSAQYHVAPGAAPVLPLEPGAAAVGPRTMPAATTSPTISPGAGNFMGSRADAGALSDEPQPGGTGRNVAADRPDGSSHPTGRLDGRVVIATSTDSGHLPTGNLALLVIIGSAAVLACSGWRSAHRRT